MRTSPLYSCHQNHRWEAFLRVRVHALRRPLKLRSAISVASCRTRSRALRRARVRWDQTRDERCAHWFCPSTYERLVPLRRDPDSRAVKGRVANQEQPLFFSLLLRQLSLLKGKASVCAFDHKDRRNGRKKARMSCTNSSGSSIAAKWPPLGNSVQR